jgi:hypothetical protein
MEFRKIHCKHFNLYMRAMYRDLVNTRSYIVNVHRIPERLVSSCSSARRRLRIYICVGKILEWNWNTIFADSRRVCPHVLCIALNCSLQEKATKWQENREIDGLTTNGVLIMHPRGSFCGGEAKFGLWREVSVGGGVFSLRESRSAQQKGLVVSVSTVLHQHDFNFQPFL